MISPKVCICLFVYLFVCLFVYLFVCLCVCVCVCPIEITKAQFMSFIQLITLIHVI